MEAKSCSFLTDGYKFQKGEIISAPRFSKVSICAKFQQNGRVSAPKQPKISQPATSLFYGGGTKYCAKRSVVPSQNITLTQNDVSNTQ